VDKELKRKNIPTIFSNEEKSLISMTGNVNHCEIIMRLKLEGEHIYPLGMNLESSAINSPVPTTSLEIINDAMGLIDI
jgi:hypothetical protein